MYLNHPLATSIAPCQFCSLDYQPNLSAKPIIMGFCLHRHCQFSCWLLCLSFGGVAHKSRAKRAPGLKTKSGKCLKGRIAFKLSTINQSEWQLRESQACRWRSVFWKLLQPRCTYTKTARRAPHEGRESLYIGGARQRSCMSSLPIDIPLYACVLYPTGPLCLAGLFLPLFLPADEPINPPCSIDTKSSPEQERLAPQDSDISNFRSQPARAE